MSPFWHEVLTGLCVGCTIAVFLDFITVVVFGKKRK